MIAEAVANHQREVGYSLEGLEKWRDKWGRLGLVSPYQTMSSAIVAHAAKYPEDLKGLLNEFRATVVDPPRIDHMDVVARAAARKRPCNSNGDGYRDTLNWLTVLALASKFDEEIVWLSENAKDFADEQDPSELHPDLVAELKSIGANSRVRWVRNLPTLMLAMAVQRSKESATDLTQLQSRLRLDTIAGFIQSDVLAAMIGHHLDPKLCGLPISTVAAEIAEIGTFESPVLSVRGNADNDEAVVEFGLEVEVRIVVDLPPGTTVDEPGFVQADETDSAVHGTVSKVLKIEGLLTLDRYDRPLGGEVGQMRALPDDEGLARWAKFEEGERRGKRRVRIEDWQSELFKGVNLDWQSEMFKGVNLDWQSQVFKGINDWQSEMFKGANLDLPSELLKGVNLDWQGGLFKGVNLDLPSELLKGVNLDWQGGLFKGISDWQSQLFKGINLDWQNQLFKGINLDWQTELFRRPGNDVAEFDDDDDDDVDGLDEDSDGEDDKQ